MEALALLSTTLQRLRVFVTVVEHQGYSAAADHLGMAQPSVSYHVRALERALGAGLLIYKDRGIHLTPEGELVFRTARTILNEGERLGETIERMRDGQLGWISLGASIAFEHQFFFDSIIAPYVRTHPEVHVSLQFAHSIDLVEGVSTGSLDMAYVNDWQIPADLGFDRLHHSELVFLVASHHELAGRARVTPDEISAAGLIAAPIESGEVISYHEMLRRAGISNPRVMIEIDGIQARKFATQAGLGVLATFVPDYVGDNAMDPLHTLPLDGEPPRIEFGIVTRRGQPWTPLMEHLGSWLRSVTTAE